MGVRETPSELSNDFTDVLARNGLPEAVVLKPENVTERSN